MLYNFLPLDTNILISFILALLCILKMIQLIVFDYNNNLLILILTISQLALSILIMVRSRFQKRLNYFQYFVIVQQITSESTNFTFALLIIATIIFKGLKIDNYMNKLIKVLICSTQICRIIIFWDGVVINCFSSIFSVVAISIIYLNSEIVVLKKSNQPTVNNPQLLRPDYVLKSETSRMVSLKKLDGEYSILESLPIGIVLLNEKYQLIFANNSSRQYFNNFYCLSDNDIVEVLLKQLTKLLLDQTEEEHHQNNHDQTAAFASKYFSSLRVDDPIKSIVNLNHEDLQLILKYKEKSLQGAVKTKAAKYIVYQQSMKNEMMSIICIEDVSSKERKKELTSFIKFQNLIINSFSHELRTPLNCSLQMLEVLASKIHQPTLVEEYIEPALNSNRLLQYQINDILDYATIQSGQFNYRYQTCNFQEIANTIKTLYRTICLSKLINIQCKVQLSNFVIVNDQERIIQVLVNLINNSIKFSPQKTNIRIQFKQKEKYREQFIKVKVKDQGYGIPDSKLSQLQKELHSVSSEESGYWATSNQISIGIGLKIANRLIKGLILSETMSNAFKIKTEFKKYTHVSFYIQSIGKNTVDQDSSNLLNDEIFKVNLSQSLDCKLIENINGKKCDCPKILIVDDVPFNVQALKMMLQKFNVSSEQAYNGMEAVDKVINRQLNQKCHPQFELIIMDLEMPLMNGIQAAQKVIQISKQILQYFQSINRQPPRMIISTAYENKKENSAYFIDELPKPVTGTTLKAILSKYHISTTN